MADIKDIVNPKDVKDLIQKDVIFLNIYKEFDVPTNWSRPPGFTSLSKMILEQQVSLASAQAHFNKLNEYIDSFSPANIIKLTDKEMKTCQISRQKAKYLRSLSGAILDGSLNLQNFEKLPENEIKRQLMNIKGIGEWTSDVYLMFCLQSKDVFPIGDIALVNTVKELKGAKTKEEILLEVEKWKPLRTLASFFLWFYYLKRRNRPVD